jgi:hypothetical protein
MPIAEFPWVVFFLGLIHPFAVESTYVDGGPDGLKFG